MKRLPITLTLPSGKRVMLESAAPHSVASDAPGKLFGGVLSLFDEAVVVLRSDKGAPVDVRDLALGDFHVLRGVLTQAGLVEEDEVDIDCTNCGEVMQAYPCRGLELGPWIDGELDDPELDRTAPFGVALDIEPISIGRVRQARTITLEPRTVRQAEPLFEALSKDPLIVDATFVRAMGIAAIGSISDAERIGNILASCDAKVFDAVTDVFIEAHYPLRLAADIFCKKCKARTTIDAPMLREFELGDDERAAPSPVGADDAAQKLPPLEQFVERAHAIADPLIAEIPGDRVEVIVDDDPPAVDDGGVPLLGSYVPPPPHDAIGVPMRPPRVTIYYRTFQAIERDEGAFDWEEELRETIEHELEHHVYFLRGDDPMDAAEHEEIDREVVRVVGRREATRRTLAVFGLSIPDFFVRAWPLVVLGALALAIWIAEARCAP